MPRLARVIAIAAALGSPTVGPLGAQQGAMVRGKVADEAGEPLADVEVVFEHLGGSGKSFKRKTNDKGSFAQVGLPAGGYQVRFSKEGYSPGSFDLHFDYGALTEIPLVTLKAIRAPTLTAAPAPAAGDQPPARPVTLSDAFREALEATRKGELDEARKLYEQILEVQPDLPEAHYNLGTILRAQDDPAGAESAFQKAIELGPDNADAYAALAAVYEAGGRGGEALELLGGVAERFAGDAAFQFNLGVMMLNASRHDVAETAFRRSVELEPSRVEGLYYLGTIAIGKGDLPAAIESLESYVAGSGQDPQNLATANALLETLSGRTP